VFIFEKGGVNKLELNKQYCSIASLLTNKKNVYEIYHLTSSKTFNGISHYNLHDNVILMSVTL